jgi:4-hydroxybenzoate polyprenyltransferase/phosphoserine phosphatase
MLQTPATSETLGSLPETPTPKRPIFVDLDGTLIAGDLGQEAFFGAVVANPWLLVTAPYHALQGLARFKSRLAEIIIPPADKLPYHADVIAELQRLKTAGHPLILATASHRVWAEPVAAHLQLFDDVLATDAAVNLKGANKLAAIERYCQEHGWTEFEYWGDAAVDLRIWNAPTSARIVAVNPSRRTLAAIQTTKKESQLFANRPSRIQAIFKAMRPQQWIKNLLLFVPILLSHKLGESYRLWSTAFTFIAFCLTASGVYLLNDSLDAAYDRQHPDKRHRPFAAGTLPLVWGPLLSFALLLAGQIIIWNSFNDDMPASARCSILVMIYIGLNMAYTFVLKRRMVIDVVCLAAMYTLRILIGGVAAGVLVSNWLLAFSITFFTSLAFAKRYAELARLAEATLLQSPDLRVQTQVLSRDIAGSEKISSPGRSYAVHDLAVISSIGPTCGYMAILVLALYINSDQMKELYKVTFPLWLICPLIMYWITRLWFIAHRNELHEDPIVFALHDRISWLIGTMILALAILATYLERFPRIVDYLFGK